MRIRRSDPAGPGYRRRRAGAGFTYVDPDGKRVIDRELRDRFAGLVIPPAWVQVWICPYANGHIQAIGTDAAGRRQYLYSRPHPAAGGGSSRPSPRPPRTRLIRVVGSARNAVTA